jgi:L,D-peptidoglycan transpeptidase YkuD (ErfK/YbiS/YcfS/YnhG family)
VYALTEAFGSDPAPDGTRLPHFRLDALDWWVSDASSPAYNTRQRCARGTCPFRESEGEHLLSHGGGGAYRLAVVFGYNARPVVPGRGSAMFLHVIGPEPTSGCVSIPYEDMVWALRWLDPARAPVLLIGGPGTRPA